jgi:hypothetical protein
MIRIKNPQDFGAAVVFILFGICGIYFGRTLNFGTAAQMGPAYFPYYLSWCVIGIGAILGARSLVLDGPAIERPRLRPLLMIVIAVLIFGYVIEYIGIVAGTVGMVVVAAYARRTVNLVETLILAGSITLFVVAVFVWGLRQPLPLWGV